MFINQFGTRIKPEKCSILCGFAVKSRLLFVIRCHTTSLLLTHSFAAVSTEDGFIYRFFGREINFVVCLHLL